MRSSVRLLLTTQDRCVPELCARDEAAQDRGGACTSAHAVRLEGEDGVNSDTAYPDPYYSLGRRPGYIPKTGIKTVQRYTKVRMSPVHVTRADRYVSTSRH